MADERKLTLKTISLIANQDAVNVKRLDASKKNLSGLGDLSACVELERLDLSQNELATLSGVGVCTQLTWLNVSKNKLESLTGVQSLKKLSVLNASHNSIQTLYHVVNLTNLKALVLNNNNISLVHDLGKLKNLNTLVLSNNAIEEIDVSSLVGLTKLSLSHNQLKSLPNLRNNRTLKELRLNDNGVTSVPSSTEFNSRLTLLDLGNNRIEELSDVRGIGKLSHHLRNLNLKGNPVCSTTDNYRKQILTIVPSLDVLDGRKVGYLDRKIYGKKIRLDSGQREDDPNSGDQDGVETKRTRKEEKPFHKIEDSTIDNEEQPANRLQSTGKSFRKGKKSTLDVIEGKVDSFEPKLLVIEGPGEDVDHDGMKKGKKMKEKKRSKSEREEKIQEIALTNQYEERNHEAIKAEINRPRKRKRKDVSEAEMHECDFQVRDKKTKQEVKAFHGKGKASKKGTLNVEAQQHIHQKQDNDFALLSSRLKESDHQQLGPEIGITGAGKPSTRRGISALGNARSGVLAIVKHKKTDKRKKKENPGGDLEFVLKSSTLHSEIGGGNESSW